MKKMITIILLALTFIALTSCDTEANRVSHNISLEADNFSVYRKITVINCIQGDILFQMEGVFSITVDTSKQKLDIIAKTGDVEYKKHFIGLSDNVTYVIEQTEAADVNSYKYNLYYNPKMWQPFTIETIE